MKTDKETRIEVLEKCLLMAMEYHRLPTDPLQVYISKFCPDIVAKFRESLKSRGVTF